MAEYTPVLEAMNIVIDAVNMTEQLTIKCPTNHDVLLEQKLAKKWG